MYEWKCKIFDKPETLTVGVVFYQSIENKVIVLKADGTLFEKKQFDKIPPTIILPRQYLKLLLKELLNLGIKPETQSFIEGELKATKYHLEDLRRVLISKNILVNKVKGEQNESRQ